MNWAGRLAVLRLSDSGKAVFQGIFEEDVISVQVEWADETGIWVATDRQAEVVTVMLIKWLHFETAQIDVLTEPAPGPKLMSFAR